MEDAERMQILALECAGGGGDNADSSVGVGRGQWQKCRFKRRMGQEEAERMQI